jgi:hypothetical protein
VLTLPNGAVIRDTAGDAVSIGQDAGSTGQDAYSVAVGYFAGNDQQRQGAVAIGAQTGQNSQGNNAVAIGTGAGSTTQGVSAVAIGYSAGDTNQGNNSIIINATGSILNQTRANTFTVAPVRNDVANVTSVMFYNTTSKEVTYGNTISIAGNINANQYNFANGVNILSTVAGTYSNANVASYLVGNISTGNLTIGTNTAPSTLTITANMVAVEQSYSNISALYGSASSDFANKNGQISSLNGQLGYWQSIISQGPGNPQYGTALSQYSMTQGQLATAQGELYVIQANLDSLTVQLVTVTNQQSNPSAMIYYDIGNVAIAISQGLKFPDNSLQKSAFGNTNVATYLISQNITSANIGAFQTYANASIGNLQANVGSFYAWANTNFSTSSYSNVSIGGNLYVSGNIVQQSAYYETYANVTNSGGNLTCNFVNGATFYATLTANVTVNFTNVVATAGRVTGATLIVDQGATAYRVANIQINSGGIQTVKYAGGTPNTGTASNTDIMSFSLISLDGTSWRVLGQISNYG